MDQDHLKNVLTYVRDVLGVESFAIAPASADDLSQALAVVTKPYLFVGSYSLNQPVIEEMQTRMVAALKLNIADFDFINIEQTNVQVELINSAQVVVVFGEEAKQSLSLESIAIGEVKANGSQKIIFTHSLTDLASSAPLKKETWAHLQSVF